MGLIEEEIKEIRQLIKQFDAGKVTKEHIHIKIALYSQTEKREKMALQAINVAAKYGKKQYRELIKSNLLGETNQLDMLQTKIIDEQEIFCPHIKKEITREYCLEREGKKEAEHGECKNCEMGITNKKLLCPPKQEHV